MGLLDAERRRLARRPAEGRGGRPAPAGRALGRASSASPGGCPRPGRWRPPLRVALAVGFLSFVAPVVLEPIFNRFRPLADERLAAELRALAERAGVPVRDVLVADASRRTTKVNAYVSGLGKTRRVVLYDTLLEAADEGELKLVVAHELGHRRERHIVKATVGAMAGAALWVVLLWALLGSRISSPRELPLVLLISLGLRACLPQLRRPRSSGTGNASPIASRSS